MKLCYKIRIWLGIIASVIGVFAFVVVTMPVSAAEGTKETILEKAILYGVQTCYNNGNVADNITSDDYQNYKSIISSGGEIILPTGYNSKNKLNCQETFGKAFEIAKQSGQTSPNTIPAARVDGPESVNVFMEGLGYSHQENNDGECATFIYTSTTSPDTPTGDIAWVNVGAVHRIKMCSPKINDNGTIGSDELEITYSTVFPNSPDQNKTTSEVVALKSKPGSITPICNAFWGTKGDCIEHTFVKGETNWASFIGEIIGDLESNRRTDRFWELNLSPERAPYGEVNTVFTFNMPAVAAQSAVRYLSNNNYTISSLALSEPEKIVLLQGYAESVFKAEKYGCNLSGDELSIATGAGYQAARIYDNGEFKTCYIKATEHTLDSVPGYNSAGFFTGEPMSWDKIIAELNSFSTTNVDGGSVGGIVDRGEEHPDSGDGGEEGSSEINCFTDGSSLGWILCPTLEILSNAVNGMYDEIADNWLEIGSGEMSNGGGVYEGWTKFRDLANIVFVIILLVVIFSQVTGLGLTNYGVKKVLPTLVMVAVLVNISFILCQLAVDVTNILGDGLRSVFEGMELSSGSGFGLSDIVTGIASGILHLAVAGGATALFVTYSGGFGMLLVPFLLVLISSLIGTVMFFLSLAIRKAGVFVMIVLCPVAIVCYALPNTKKFFDKWMKLFMGLLMIYPICGILMGGGKFFSSVILTTGTGFFMALTAMLIQVVPFFFIPSLVKGSLNVMGNIGTKLSGLGSRITRGAQGTLGHSRWAQDRQQRLMRDSNLRRDTRLANRGEKTLSALKAKRDANGGQLSKRDQRRYRRAEYETARAASRYRRVMAEDAQASFDAARGLPTEGSIQYMNMMDSLKNSADAKELEEWGAALLNGHMDYSDADGIHTIDSNNMGKLDANGNQISTESPETSLSSAFLHYLNAFDNAEDGSEEQKIAGIKARAIATRLLDAGGDNGQTIVTNALRGRKFDANGNALGRSQTKSVDAMSEYIARNGKWMGQIKKTDTGSFAFINDSANKTATIKTRAEYHTMGDKKVTAAAIPGLSDGFFEGFKQEINTTDANGNTIFDTNNEAAQRLLDIDDAAQRALSDERISNEMKPETVEYLEAIHQKAYKVRQKRWLEGQDSSGVDNIKQLHGFNAAGREVEAAGKDTNGFLLDNTGNRLLDAAGGSPLQATDAYSRQIRRYVKYESGKRPTSGEIKILRKKEMPDHWTYDNNAGKWKMIDISRGINRDLTPEEVERAKSITRYNAEVEQLNTENNLNP